MYISWDFLIKLEITAIKHITGYDNLSNFHF